VDEVLPPAFISNRNNLHPGDEAIEKAVTLLSREHCTARLEKVWGPGDGRPVSELKEVIDQIIEVRSIYSWKLDFSVQFIWIFFSYRSIFYHENLTRLPVVFER
jgi:programmed cell death protein 4